VGDRRVVRERIDPRLTAALFGNYRSPLDAFLELVDNAVDSRVAGRPLEIEVSTHPGRLVLTAVGGAGMGPGAIERDYAPPSPRRGRRRRHGATTGRGRGGRPPPRPPPAERARGGG
jgi:hypothetical protein